MEISYITWLADKILNALFRTSVMASQKKPLSHHYYPDGRIWLRGYCRQALRDVVCDSGARSGVRRDSGTRWLRVPYGSWRPHWPYKRTINGSQHGRPINTSGIPGYRSIVSFRASGSTPEAGHLFFSRQPSPHVLDMHNITTGKLATKINCTTVLGVYWKKPRIKLIMFSLSESSSG